jgi:hypothetical protein
MNWSDVGNKLRSIAGVSLPAIGTALGGPAGAAVGVMLGKALGTDTTPDAVAAALDPEAAVKLRQIEADLSKAQIDADVSVLQAVNTTMQTEAKADHWPTYSWRPFVGFCFGIAWLGDYMALPLLHIPVPTVPPEAWLAIGGVLGVASWFRGKMQADPTVASDNRG